MTKGKKSSLSDTEVGGYDRRKLLKTGACAGLGLALSSAGLSCCPRCVSEAEAARLTDDEFAMFGYCCVECNKCEAYVATQNNDGELKAKVAKQWKMKAEEVVCDGDVCIFVIHQGIGGRRLLSIVDHCPRDS